MIIEPEWLDYIPGKDMQGAISFLNGLGWNISFSESAGQRKVFGGDRLLFSTEYEKEVESFIFGMALGLAVLPDKVIDEIRKIAEE